MSISKSDTGFCQAIQVWSFDLGIRIGGLDVSDAKVVSKDKNHVGSLFSVFCLSSGSGKRQ